MTVRVDVNDLELDASLHGRAFAQTGDANGETESAKDDCADCRMRTHFATGNYVGNQATVAVG